MALNNVAETVRKLLDLAAEGSGATPAEAAQAAATAQKLVNKYQLDLAEVLADAKARGETATVEQEPVGQEMYVKSKRVPMWEAALGFNIAPAFSCRTYRSPGRGLWVVGRATNRAAFIATVQYLTKAIEGMAKRTCPSHVHGREWNNSFGFGAAATIIERVKGESAQIAAANPSMALAISNEGAVVDAWLNASIKLRAGGGTRARSNGGREAGRNAAHALNLGSVPGRTQNNALRLKA